MASKQGTSASPFGTGANEGIVEVSLLLPVGQVEALLDLSRQRRQSVGQILRGLIGRALTETRETAALGS
jgi:hypothetical protein